MTDQIASVSAPAEATPPPASQPAEITAPSSTPERISLRQAADAVRAARKPKEEPSPSATNDAARARMAAPATPSSETDDAAPLETEAPGATEAIDPAGSSQEGGPPIEPPRSWTAEEKDAFRALPRDTQQRIAEREKGRETEFRRGQNEVDEKRKAVDAERERMEKARTQYETALPQLLQSLHQNPEFADIKSMEDVERMANEDWPRFARWQFHQQKVQAVEAELKNSQTRQQQEARTQWEHFAKRQDELFLEKAPEMQDATKRTKTVEAATNLLKERGYSPEEIERLWASPVFRDHRTQLLILDAVRFQDAKKSLVEATRKPLPPVQRPGVSQPGKDREAQLKDLESKLDRSSGMMNQVKAAAALLAAKRASKR
jgi:hypothetical protein